MRAQLPRMLSVAALALAIIPVVASEAAPPVGSSMAPFALPDQTGTRRELRDVLGPQGAVIVFYRTTTWCPYCKAVLLELERSRPDFRKLGLGIAAVSPDSQKQLNSFASARGIQYPLLSDSNSKLIQDLGILDESIPVDSSYRGIPYPCVFVLDGRGVILGKYFEDDKRQRYTPDDILKLRFGTTAAARRTAGESKNLRFTGLISNSLVIAGTRVAFQLDINIEPGIQVYGRGAKPHVPLELRVDHSAAIPAFDVHYPNPEHGAYSGHLLLKGYLLMGKHADLKAIADGRGEFEVNATLRFQACGDECFPPEEIPVRWRLRYAGFDQP